MASRPWPAGRRSRDPILVSGRRHSRRLPDRSAALAPGRAWGSAPRPSCSGELSVVSSRSATQPSRHHRAVMVAARPTRGHQGAARSTSGSRPQSTLAASLVQGEDEPGEGERRDDRDKGDRDEEIRIHAGGAGLPVSRARFMARERRVVRRAPDNASTTFASARRAPRRSASPAATATAAFESGEPSIPQTIALSISPPLRDVRSQRRRPAGG